VDITGFTLGKESNTAALNVNDTINVAGPINIYGGDITISEGLNTTSGREDGTVLLKSATNITLLENKNITTSGGNVVCWSRKNGGANNGMIVFEGNNEITTGDSVVFGGHVWLGGNSDPNNGMELLWETDMLVLQVNMIFPVFLMTGHLVSVCLAHE
jgi:hypothetical protein